MKAKGIFETRIVKKAESILWATMKKTVEAGIESAPWLNGAQVFSLRYDANEFNLRVTMWDKRLTRLGGLCSVLYDQQMLESTLFGSRFKIWGWAESPAVLRSWPLKT